MNLTNEKVIHQKHGNGTIIAVDESNRLTVDFNGQVKKMAAYIEK